MTGAYTPEQPPKCHQYAQFMKHLNRHAADAIFWTLFCATVFLLILSSMMFAKAARTHKQACRHDEDARQKNRKTRRTCLIISLLCFILELGFVIIQAFAAFNIEFCDGEDLMMLYWAFWTLLQIGSLIAILGICLSQWYSLNDKEQPPWEMALGGPVPVIAALGHAWHVCAKGAWHNYKKKKTEEHHQKQDEEEHSESGNMSRASTVHPPTPIARHVGFTLENEPLFALPTSTQIPQFCSSDLLRQAELNQAGSVPPTRKPGPLHEVQSVESQ